MNFGTSSLPLRSAMCTDSSYYCQPLPPISASNHCRQPLPQTTASKHCLQPLPPATASSDCLQPSSTAYSLCLQPLPPAASSNNCFQLLPQSNQAIYCSSTASASSHCLPQLLLSATASTSLYVCKVLFLQRTEIASVSCTAWSICLHASCCGDTSHY